MNNLAQDTTGYYSSVSALTPKDVQASVVEELPAATDTQLSISLLFLPFAIFFGLFIGAVIVEIAKKTATVKRIMSAFVIAFIVSLTPFAAQIVSQGNINSYLKAGPDITPRDIRIETGERSLIVSWTTGAEVTGAIRVWKEDRNDYQILISSGGMESYDHLVVLEQPEKVRYRIEFLSGSRWYDNRGQPLIVDLRGS